jgi:hypothetical protein
MVRSYVLEWQCIIFHHNNTEIAFEEETVQYLHLILVRGGHGARRISTILAPAPVPLGFENPYPWPG